ncbi:MAG: hypothetical protein M1833_007059 [Piccolia ochrophora]|nr:MAG: hypothetical protein M1833_007059 [Piccolia ochrophora]
MDRRAEIPPGLPRHHPTVSYWQDPPDPICDLRSTEQLPAQADFVVIGSGISGATIAFNILEQRPHASVVILEARQACSGATGRNGGHQKPRFYRSFLSILASHGLDEALKMGRLEYNCFKAENDFIHRHGIDCDQHSTTTLDVIYEQEEWDYAVKSLSAMAMKMEPGEGAATYKLHDAEHTRRDLLCPDAVGAVEYEAGSIRAYAFVIGILKLALSKDLNLQTNTPAEAISPEKSANGQWTVRTSRGDIKSSKVIMATNGYSAHLYHKLQGIVVPLRGQVQAQRPGKDMPQKGLRNTYSMVYSTGYEYMISQQPGSKNEGDLIMGGGLRQAKDEGLYEYGETDDTSLNPIISKHLRECTPAYFRDSWGQDNEEGRVRMEWTGIMGYTPDGFPLIGKMPGEDGLYVSAAFQGHGMVLSFLCARALTEILLGNDGKELDSWFPRSFRITEERLTQRFEGQKDVLRPSDLELKSRL